MRNQAMLAMLGALSFALPATAMEFQPPKGCATYLTVQSKQCAVSLLWRCDVSPDTQWEATFGPEGLEAVVSYADNYQWLDAIYLWDRSREELVRPAADPIDIDALIETGVDTYDFTMHRSEPGGEREVRLVGADELTGRTTAIDGYDLELVATEIQVLSPEGEVEYHSRGMQYLSRELRLFFLGPDTVIEPDGTETDYDGSPVDIIQPGEPGFGATTPIYECDHTDATFLPTAPRTGQKETTHDEL